MQVGPSRELFELWAPDARNGLIITGYSIEGTLARVSVSPFGRGVVITIHILHVSTNSVYTMMKWICFPPPLLSFA